MAEKKRQCGTCRFFVETGIGAQGRCTHPLRAGADAELLLLRPTELACRTKWGTSLWQDPADDSDPTAPKSPQQPTLPEPIAAQLQYDDEVTSVSIAGSKNSRSSFEDDVVDSGAVTTGMASWNDPEQEERLDLLRKSSHDALAGARKRHMEKQARQRELIPFAEDDAPDTDEPKPNASPETPSQPERSPVRDKERGFPPDDFVEDERTAAKDDDRIDDEMVDEGVTPNRLRSPRMRKLLRESNNPKSDKAMRLGLPAEMKVTSHNPDQRGQWNTVPTIDPGIELPLSKPANKSTAQSGQEPIKVAASAAPVASTPHQVRPVSQARELISEDRLRQGRAQRQMVAPLADESLPANRRQEPRHSESNTVTDRPRLTQAPPTQRATLDQVKSSPLRGYHPAPKQQSRPVQQREQPESRRERQPAQSRQRVTSNQTHEWDAEEASPLTEVRQQRPERQRQPQPQQEALQRRRPYIPLQQVSENTPFVREEIEIAPDVPRCCGTCSSYRPSGVAGRGSCTNAFAGPVQRVVYEQDLACQHTFGSFWLPADEEVWLDELSDHSAPTPRVDAMLARRRKKSSGILPDLEELTS